MIEKLSSGCDKSCRETKQTTLNKLDQIKEAVEKEEKRWDDVNKHLQNGSKVLSEIANFVSEYDKATYNWETHQKRLIKDITKAYNNSYLTVDQYNQMKKQVETATTFNPAIMGSLHDIKDKTEQELATRRRQSQKKMGNWKQIKVELKAADLKSI